MDESNKIEVVFGMAETVCQTRRLNKKEKELLNESLNYLADTDEWAVNYIRRNFPRAYNALLQDISV